MTQAKRFRAPIIIGVIAGLLVGGMISWAFVFNDVAAQDTVGISFDVAVPITKVTKDKENVNDSPEFIQREAGDPCYWSDVLAPEEIPDSTITTRGITDHVVVTDASGTIVAAAPLQGTIVKPKFTDEGIDESVPDGCVIPIDVDVPESIAYTIRIQDTYVATIGSDGIKGATVFYPFRLGD